MSRTCERCTHIMLCRPTWKKNPPGASPPIRSLLTFRFIVNRIQECSLSGIHGAPAPFDLGAARLPAQPLLPPPLESTPTLPPAPPTVPPPLTVPPPPTQGWAAAGDSADVGGSEVMVDAGTQQMPGTQQTIGPYHFLLLWSTWRSHRCQQWTLSWASTPI